jgi:hypothetical protein
MSTEVFLNEQVIKNYIISLSGAQDINYRQQNCLVEMIDGTDKVIYGTVVSDEFATYGVVHDGIFYEGVALIKPNSDMLIIAMQGDPTKIEELV